MHGVIKSFFDEIRRALDKIESYIEYRETEQPTEQQLAWLVGRISAVNNHIIRHYNAPGRGKSYKVVCQHTRDTLKDALRELQLWQTEGLLPMGSEDEIDPNA